MGRMLGDLSLRTTITLALCIGLLLPVGVAVWRDVDQRRDTLLGHLRQDHERLVDVLAIGMQTPVWDVRPDTGEPLIRTVMRDERVVSVEVSAPYLPTFLSAQRPERAEGAVLILDRPILHDDRRIGTVRVAMSTAALEAQIAAQWQQVLQTGLLQLALGLLILFPLLRFKVLNPIGRLSEQARALAGGELGRALEWRRDDEFGTLGRSFEETRRSLSELIDSLARRNHELQQREAELARNGAVLRTTFDNMSDGITVVDGEWRLIAWNRRAAEITGLPGDLLRPGARLDEIAAEKLSRHGYTPRRIEGMLEVLRDSFDPAGPGTARYRTVEGREVEVKRRAMPDGGFVSTYFDVTEESEARRHADETLQLLKAVMDAVPAVIHVKDRHLRFEMVNERFLQSCGRPRDAVLGLTEAELGEIADGGQGARLDEQILASRQPVPFFESETVDAEGRSGVIWATKVPLLDADGEVAHIVSAEIDITDRKRAEQERQRWLQLFRDAIESMPQGFAVFDRDRRLLTCNSSYASLYDRASSDMVGMAIEDILRLAVQKVRTTESRFVPNGESGLADLFRQLWAGEGRPFQVELTDGRWMLMGSHPTAEGGFVYVRTDVTDLKRMQQALSESEERFRSITEAHPVPVVIVRIRDGEVLYASPAAAQLWGRPQEAIPGSSFPDFFVDPAEEKGARETFLAEGLLDNHEARHQRDDGTVVPVALAARPIVYQGDEAIVAGIYDLTERKAAERQIAEQREALYQSEKLNALGALLAGVAHELNNPLSVVVAQALLLRETAQQPRTRQRAQRIADAADRCARIVKTFLSMARQSSPKRAEVDLNEVVGAALDVTGYGLRSADVETVCRLAPDLPPVWADGDQLTQVLMNLIVNAQQAMAEQTPPRRLEIRSVADPEAAQVKVEVGDNGPGIAGDLRSRIFEPFFTTKAEGIGTGVGLSISRGIVEALGGTISVESEPGRGARFIIALPAAAAGRSRPCVPVAAPCSGICRILIVDDEPEVAEMLSDILAVDGHAVDTAPSGNAALARLGAAEYDLILSDLRMPDLDGPGLYRKLSETMPGYCGRIAFVTGDTLSATVRGFLEQTGLPCLEKPFTPDEVRRLVVQLATQRLDAAAQ